MVESAQVHTYSRTDMQIDGVEYMSTADAAKRIAELSGRTISEGRVRQLVVASTIKIRALGNTNWLTVESVEDYGRNRPKWGWPAGKSRKDKKVK